jgi:RNA polymerase sigma-70 factor (ECF subfamily)
MALRTASDSDLVIAFGRRQVLAAYEELVSRWDHRVLAFLVKSTGDYEAAQDLRQEVFLRLYRYAGTYKPEFAFTTWFFRIVRNVLSTWRTRESKRLRLVERDDELPRIVDLRPSPRTRAEETEAAEAVRAAIDRLAPDEREVLLLRFDVGLSYREIGEIQAAPETTVKSRVYKLLGQLKESLHESGVVRQAREQ